MVMRAGRRWERLLLCVAVACLLPASGSLQPLFGGQITWRVDEAFNAGQRKVTLTLTSAVGQSNECDYIVGARPQCAGAELAHLHGMLCVAQLVPAPGGGLRNRHWVSGHSCVSELNRLSGQVQTAMPEQQVEADMVGGANNMTVSHVYDGNNVTSEFRTLGGVRVVVGQLEKVISVAQDASAIIAWLAPSESNGTEPQLLLRQCQDAAMTGLSNSTGAPCSVNANTTRLDGAHATPDPYWGAWGADTLPSASRSDGAAALETFVQLCSSVSGDACSLRPVRNFHSPVAVLPPLIEVAVTAWTRRAVNRHAASHFIGKKVLPSDLQ